MKTAFQKRFSLIKKKPLPWLKTLSRIQSKGTYRESMFPERHGYLNLPQFLISLYTSQVIIMIGKKSYTRKEIYYYSLFLAVAMLVFHFLKWKFFSTPVHWWNWKRIRWFLFFAFSYSLAVFKSCLMLKTCQKLCFSLRDMYPCFTATYICFYSVSLTERYKKYYWDSSCYFADWNISKTEQEAF